MKNKKLIMVLITIVILGILGTGAFFMVKSTVLPNNAYNQAMDAEKRGDYQEAYQIYESLKDYKDSKKKMKEAKRAQADALMKAKKYDEAYDLYEELGQYKIVNKSKKKRADAFMKKKDYEQAYPLYCQIGETRTVKESKYERAKKAMAKGEYEKAIGLLTRIWYRDSQSLLAQANREYLKNLHVGSEIVFGRYEQDGVKKDGKEDIEWIVVERTEHSALLISKFALAFCEFGISQTGLNYEGSKVREWLNKDFYDEAFSDLEKARILDTDIGKIEKHEVEEQKNTGDGRNLTETDIQEAQRKAIDADSAEAYAAAAARLNAIQNSTGTVVTEVTDVKNVEVAAKDKLFLLSVPEVEKYFASNGERSCRVTAYAERQGVEKKFNRCAYWLRTLGTESNKMAYVDAGGKIHKKGADVSFNPFAVRPAVWIYQD